ncbi:MAG: DUF4390 domain-containing protein [Desulfobacterales bacterium]
MNFPRKQKTAAVVLLGLVLCWQTAAFGQEARLTDIIVTNTRDDLLLYLKVEGAFHEKMKTVIHSGIPTTFAFFIDLNRVRSLWPDKRIAALKATHSITYNTLKKEYTLVRSWDSAGSVTTQSFVEAQRLMTEIDSLKIVPLQKLLRGAHYQIRTKAELSKLTLPFYLHYVLFFVSLWDFKTDWYTIDFVF